MGTIASTPRQDAQPKEHADYLLGVLVGEKNFDLQSSLWQRLLGLPLTLYWPDNVIEEACESLARNNTFTSHFAKLLIHLAWSLQEAASVKPTVHEIFAKGINAVRFSCVFLKYFIDHLKSDQMERLLSICLNEKDAEATGLSTGKKSVAVLVVPALMDFIVNSDINPSTYLLHLEVVNLLLVMMATQLHSEASLETKDCHIFLDTAMAQEKTLVSLFIRKLLLSYITTLPVPADAAYYISISKRNQLGLIHRVGSAAAVFWCYLVNSKSYMATSPLAQNSLLLLLVLVHYRKNIQIDEAIEKTLHTNGEAVAAGLMDFCLLSNPFRQAVCLARDTKFDIVDVEGCSTQESFFPRIPFSALYDTLGSCLMDECSTLLLYSLVHYNSAFLEYVLVRTDVDTLIMPVLEMLYNASKKTPSQIYMLLIILLILSQDSSFNANVHKLVLPDVPWYKERILNQTTLGSLMIVILIRTLKYNLSKLRDVYLHTNCLATLSNMAPYACGLNAYAAQRLVSLLDMLFRKYIKSANVMANGKIQSLKEGLEPGQYVPTELHTCTNFLRIVLEVINAIITYVLPHNPEVVYALLHQQELFKPFRDHPQFHELLENIYTVLDFFNTRVDAQDTKEEWSAEKILQVIIANTRSWRGEGMKMFTQLRFTYEEEIHCEEFFAPYVWQLVVSKSGIKWSFEIPNSTDLKIDRLEYSNERI